MFWTNHVGDAQTYQSICEKPQSRVYADLCQQWKAAEAAKQVEARYKLKEDLFCQINDLNVRLKLLEERQKKNQ